MSGRYWLPIIAVVGLTLAAQADGIGDKGAHQPGTTQSAAKPKPNPPPAISVAVQDNIERIARALETANSKPESSSEKTRAEQDLQAQKDMVVWARGMFWAGSADVILTIIGVFLIWRTLIHTRAAAKAAEESARISKATLTDLERPRVFPDKIRLVRSFDDLLLEYSISNHGRTAALLEQLYYSISLTIKEDEGVRAAHERTHSHEMTELLPENGSLPVIKLEISPPIQEFVQDISSGILVMSVFTSLSYRSLNGTKYDLIITHEYIPSENRMARKDHYEQVNGKLQRATAA